MTRAARPDASRLLLQRVREVAATVVDKQDRLDGITAEIADVMAAEVCSIYIRHGDNRLWLTATRGLNQEAVHTTALAVGEGLVGLVAESARPVNLSEATAHENFAYRPETGEEAFHSFVGVPLLRGGLVVGVLTVQNVRPGSTPRTRSMPCRPWPCWLRKLRLRMNRRARTSARTCAPCVWKAGC